MLSNWFNNELDDYQQALVLLILVGCGWYLWGVLSDWDQLKGINRYIAFFYYSFVVWPLSGNSEIWDFMQNFTSFKTLNFIFGVISCLFYSMVLLGLYVCIKEWIDSILSPGSAVIIFCFPAIIALFVWVFN